MENAPQMTPEMYAELNGNTPEANQQPMAQPQPEAGVTPQDDVAQAKELLGISETENTLTQMQEQMQTMQEDKVKETMSAKYPDVPYDIVEKEIAKVEAINPKFAKSMRTTPDGMDMAYRASQASMSPQEKPDNLTDGESGGGQGENLDEVVRKGEASDYDLGQFIIGGK